MSNPVLVVLGSMEDPHVERVVKELKSRGRIDPLVVDYLNGVRFEFRTDSNGRVSFELAGRHLSEPYLVWDRRKIAPGTHLYIRGDEQSSGYAAREWRAFYSLLCGVNGEMVVNSLASRQCMIKPYQQMIAAKAGLLVPNTIMTNDRGSALSFMGECDGRVIMKSISAGKVKPSGECENIPYVVMTMRVSEDDLRSATEEEFEHCPSFFQQELMKKHEFRVVYVDGKIHAFRVDSQRCRTGEVDWRKGFGFVQFESGDLDPATLGSIDRFMRSMGLFSGSIDLIVDTDDRVWFLECNQDGAWGWVDDIVDGAVTRAFADGFEARLLGAAALCGGEKMRVSAVS